MNAPTCSESSAAAGEPLAGTAVANTWRWLGIEYRGAWGARAVEDADLSPALRGWLDGFLGHEGTRAQLLRQPGRDGPPAVVFADTTPGAERVWRLAVPDLEALADIDPRTLLAGTVPGLEPAREPMVWVCTNGQRDVCCARHGGRLFTALRRRLGERVWQTTHLGGHRFAATLLWLPEGLCYGRLREADARPLVAAALDGRIHDLGRIRGRCAWSRPVQAAEVALRERAGDRGLAAPALLDVEEEGATARVTFGPSDRPRRVRVDLEPLRQALIQTCGKPPAEGTRWVAMD